MPKSTTIYEFDEQDVRRGLLLRFEELYGFKGVLSDDFFFDLSHTRINKVTVTVSEVINDE